MAYVREGLFFFGGGGGREVSEFEGSLLNRHVGSLWLGQK